jgi:hypothetical protein
MSIFRPIWDQCFDHNFAAIFGNFRRKNWRFSHKTKVIIKFLHNFALFLVKNANILSPIFVAKIFFKNHSIAP